MDVKKIKEEMKAQARATVNEEMNRLLDQIKTQMVLTSNLMIAAADKVLDRIKSDK